MKKEIFRVLFLLGTLLTQTQAGAQTWQWAREEQSEGEGYGICNDNSGNVFLSGSTSGTSVIGSYTNSNSGPSAVTVKYDSNGNVLWAAFIPSANGNNVACDASGNVFLCGYFSTVITIGSQIYTPQGTDIFLVKYSPTGTVLWSTTTGGASFDIANGVTVDSQGNAIVSGYIGVGTMTIGSSVLTNTSGTKYFMAKFDNIGTPLWAYCGASGNSQSYSICRDANDDLYLTGSYSGATSIGANTFIPAGSNDFYLAKFSTSGNPLWSISGGGQSNDYAYFVSPHPSGDVFVTGGYASASCSLSTTTFTNAGSSDMFLARFNNSGSLLWALHGGGPGFETGYSLASHPGGAYVAGAMDLGSMTIATTTITSTALSDNMFLCGIDNSGNVVYSQNINGGGDDVMALAMYNGCSLYLGGDILTPTLVLGAFTLTHTYGEVLFVAKFNTGINPTLNLSPSYTLCAPNSLTLTASGASTYTWSGGPNTGSYVVSPTSTAVYFVSGTNSLTGCWSTASVQVTVDNCTALEVRAAAIRLLISPNPTAREFNVQTEKRLSGGRLLIRDLSGQIVYSQLIDDEWMHVNTQLAPGMYLLSIEQAGSEIVCKKMAFQ